MKSYGYAADDRVAALSYANAKVATAPVKFSYDAFFPRLTTMVDGTGTTRFQYQPVGAPGALQLALEDGPYGNDGVAYAYDALGRVATRTVDTAVESFAYDAIGRVITHSSPLGVFARTYLGQTGQMTGHRSASGVGTQWAYEGSAGDRRLRSITNSGQARSFSYATTPEDLISGITESVGGTVQRSWAYGYDATDRLTKAQPSTGAAFLYAYDKADNLTSVNGVAATVNSANQLVTFGGKPYSYDANGNLSDDGTRTYRWDAEDRLVGIGYKTRAGTATAFRYDGMGRRLAIIDTNQFGPNETRYLWCGDSLCQARTVGDQVTRRYFPEGLIIPQGNTLLYYGKDHLGSVRELSTAQNGARVASFDYDPYGNQIAASGRVASDFRYAGMFFHSTSGLYLSYFRAYDSKSARWLSRDPLREWGSVNVYNYANSSPILYTDQTGLTATCPPNINGISPKTCYPDAPEGYAPYGGKSSVYHCGGKVFLEKRGDISTAEANPVAECVYDSTGGIIDDGHPYRMCQGTPDSNPYYNDGTIPDAISGIKHAAKDPGGPSSKLPNGQTLGDAAAQESKRYKDDMARDPQGTQAVIDAHHNGILPAPPMTPMPVHRGP